MADNIIEIDGVSFTYSEEEYGADGRVRLVAVPPAVNNVTLSVKRGEYLAVLGHNGSGKSTLAKLLNMILTPSCGKILIDGVEITASSFTEDDIFEVRQKVGMVFQNPDNQLVATVVEEDVAFGPENLGIPREQIQSRIDEALKLVGMTEYRRHAPHKLSGGQKQRVAIAGIIAMRPKIIIFDESTAMLDPKGRMEILAIMEKLVRDEGITVINITHHMDEAARADRVVIMNDGAVVRDGAPREIFAEVDFLHSIGLEAPQATELIARLRSLGVAIDSDALSAKECADAIFALFREEGEK